MNLTALAEGFVGRVCVIDSPDLFNKRWPGLQLWLADQERWLCSPPPSRGDLLGAIEHGSKLLLYSSAPQIGGLCLLSFDRPQISGHIPHLRPELISGNALVEFCRAGSNMHGGATTTGVQIVEALCRKALQMAHLEKCPQLVLVRHKRNENLKQALLRVSRAIESCGGKQIQWPERSQPVAGAEQLQLTEPRVKIGSCFLEVAA